MARSRPNSPPESKPQSGLTPFEKILCTVLHEAHGRQVEQTMESLDEDLKAPTGGHDSFRHNPSP